MKNIFSVIAKRLCFLAVLVVIGITVVPPVQAQDMKRLQELAQEVEQIETRANARGGNYTPQEIQRMQDIGVEMLMLTNPGMTRAQALAMMRQGEMRDYQEDAQSAEARRQIQEYEEQQRQNELIARQAEEQERRLRQQQQQEAEQRRMYPGDTRGWPAAAWFRNLNVQLASLRQPAGTNASYDREGTTVYLNGGSANTVMQDLVRQINAATGMNMSRNNDGSYTLSIPDNRASWTIRVWQEDGTVRLSIWWSM